ncbi:hypothetical protein QE152_g38559 [Popillia japonica]|uniref:Uncharacterized protein n=1 Tax=Popillia japonica TaxID=7064 RepID=A0AAW1HW35_POPJA
MSTILKHRQPKNLQTDSGKEFYNQHFNALMKLYDINHYSTYSVTKASIAERVIRTLKEKVYKEFSLRGTYNWTTILDEITKQYNNTKHRTIGMKPKDVTAKSNLHAHIKVVGKQQKFSLNDVVRISKYKSIFDEGYTPNWSTELFRIAKVKLTNPVTYLLDDMNARPILGSFYAEELQKAKHQDAYLVEKVLRRKGNKVYVKWLGFDKTHNSWIAKNNIL